VGEGKADIGVLNASGPENFTPNPRYSRRRKLFPVGEKGNASCTRFSRDTTPLHKLHSTKNKGQGTRASCSVLWPVALPCVFPRRRGGGKSQAEHRSGRRR